MWNASNLWQSRAASSEERLQMDVVGVRPSLHVFSTVGETDGRESISSAVQAVVDVFCSPSSSWRPFHVTFASQDPELTLPARIIRQRFHARRVPGRCLPRSPASSCGALTGDCPQDCCRAGNVPEAARDLHAGCCDKATTLARTPRRRLERTERSRHGATCRRTVALAWPRQAPRRGTWDDRWRYLKGKRPV